MSKHEKVKTITTNKIPFVRAHPNPEKKAALYEAVISGSIAALNEAIASINEDKFFIDDTVLIEHSELSNAYENPISFFTEKDRFRRDDMLRSTLFNQVRRELYFDTKYDHDGRKVDLCELTDNREIIMRLSSLGAPFTLPINPAFNDIIHLPKQDPATSILNRVSNYDDVARYFRKDSSSAVAAPVAASATARDDGHRTREPIEEEKDRPENLGMLKSPLRRTATIRNIDLGKPSSETSSAHIETSDSKTPDSGRV